MLDCDPALAQLLGEAAELALEEQVEYQHQEGDQRRGFESVHAAERAIHLPV
jgi:hypothetical protein